MTKYKKAKKIQLILIVLFLSILVFLFTSLKFSKVLVIEDLDEKKTTNFVLLDNEFILGYTHSVLLTPAEEYFSVGDENNLNLYKTVYESFGVGLPFSQEKYEFDIVGEKFIMKVERVYENIHMRISPIPDHWILVNGTRHELIDIVEKPEDLIKIYATGKWTVKILGKSYILS